MNDFNYLNNFRAHVDGIRSKGLNNTPTTDETKAPASEEVKSLPNVTPDYNVTVPVGYQKLGVEKLENGQEIHCYKLNNGQKVFIAPKEGSTTVLNTYVNTGSMNEKDDERGISHFCEHMAFNGTNGSNGYEKLGVGDVFRKIDKMGGNTNASTSFAETNYTISIPQFKQDDLETIIKMQAAMMNDLEMSKPMVDKEHGPVTSEINMYSDMPDNIALNTAIKNLYNINTTSDDIVAGTVNNIMNVDSNKVMNYYKNNYYPANMITVVTGDVNPDKTIDLIAKNFRGENPTKPERRHETFTPIQHTVRKDIISPKAVATTGVLCFDGPENNNTKDIIAVNALNKYLFNNINSVSKQQLKDYGVEVSAAKDKIRTEPNDSTLLSLTFDSTEDNSEVALKSIYNTIANFKPLSDEEMDTLKTGLKMDYEMQCENSDSLNYMIGQDALAGNFDLCKDAIKQIDSLTSEDLVNALHKYYDLNKVSIAVIHPDKANVSSISENHNKAKSISFTGTEAIQNANKTTNNEKVPLKTDKIDNYTLDNKVNVALINTNNDVATVSAYLTSPVPANTKPGVAEVLSEIISRGTKEKVAITNKNNVNSFTGASENHEYYEATLPAKNITVGMELMKDTLFNPAFNEETFEKAKNYVKNELLTTQPNAYDNLKNDLFAGTPKGYSNKDILNNIDNVTLADVEGLHKYLTDNSGMTFVASVPMQKYPNMKNVINNELMTLSDGKPLTPKVFNDYTPTEKTKVVTDTANTAQADIIEAFKFPLEHNPKEIATCELMNSILSSGDETGLFNNLREKEKLAYSVRSGFNFSSYKTATIACNILTTTDSPDMKSYDNVQKSINGFNRQINKMKNGEFTDDELATAKLNFKRKLLQATEDSIDKVTSISQGMNSVNGMDEINKQYVEIDNITKDDIVNATNKVFNNKPLYSIRASKDTLDANKDFLSGLENN